MEVRPDLKEVQSVIQVRSQAVHHHSTTRPESRVQVTYTTIELVIERPKLDSTKDVRNDVLASVEPLHLHGAGVSRTRRKAN